MCRQKQHKPWFDEECSQVLGQRKQAKMQWIQNPNQSNSDNLNKLVDISGTKRGNIWKPKLMN
jgi:hypothetical protein